ncbi:MAG: ABC transporter permease [Mailhella sp.]|nr:ABC transporter permease [Mailhella sp.]
MSGRAKSLAVIFALLALWELACSSGLWTPYVLPSPGRVIRTAIAMFNNGELTRHVSISVSRVLTGFSISCALALILGTLAALHPRLDPYYRHLLEIIRHIPPMSLIPLLILWFGIGETAKIIIIVLTSFFPVYLNTESGFAGCDAKLLEVGRSLGFGKAELFRRIMLPAAVPSILVGMRIGLGYSWRAIVGAEMIAAASGLGYMILDAQALSRSDKVIVGIILIGCIGFLTDKLFGFLTRLLTPRHGGAAL